ncbi:MAG TPA: hypothetical protein VFR41_14840 [Acidimicrobiia bacterium]|nr:hypothetical protein [Acidimicrobiia bacterium]
MLAFVVATALTAGGLGTSAHAATYLGSLATASLTRPVVGMAPTPSGSGYWLVASNGSVWSFGDANLYGSAAHTKLAYPIVGIAGTRTGAGYWLIASNGSVFHYGDAVFHGSTSHMTLRKPIVGGVATPSGNGYWLVASNGSVFPFGDAKFYGSTAYTKLSYPIIGMAPTATGKGYWLAAGNGSVFRFGDAVFYGSASHTRLSTAIISIAATSTSTGYWMLEANGTVLGFGNASYFGTAQGKLGGQPAVGLVAPRTGGFWIASQWGSVTSASSSGIKVDPSLPRTGESAIRSELVNRINSERVARGLAIQTRDATLDLYAQSWANHLASTNTWEHQDLSIVLAAGDGRFGEIGENLFAGSGPGATDAGTAHTALMDSDRAPRQHAAAREPVCRYRRRVHERQAPRGRGLRHAELDDAARARHTSARPVRSQRPGRRDLLENPV